MKKQSVYLLAGWVWTLQVSSAVIPNGSQYDSRMQQVNYNPHNTTIINTGMGYVSTLVFAEDEAVISTQVGFQKGWSVITEANRVYLRPVPITQPEEDNDDQPLQKVYMPTADEWKTNLFVTTTQHFYSMELNVLDKPNTSQPLAFVVTWHYPQAVQQKAAQTEALRQKARREEQAQQQVAQALKKAKMPRNWDYQMRLEENSRLIAPDFTYDDGRFTYLGFSPLKKFPSAFLYQNGQEQIVNFSVEQQGNYQVMVIHQLNPTFVLRYGDAVVGIINQGFGKVIGHHGNTISSAVVRVEAD